MGKLIKDWEKQLPHEKIFRILSLIFSLAGLVLAIQGLLQAFEALTAETEFLPMALLCLGANALCQAVCTWKKDRTTAIINLCSGVFVIACALVGLYLRSL